MCTIHCHADISTTKHVSRGFRSSIVTTRESVSVDKEHSKQYGGQASVDNYKRCPDTRLESIMPQNLLIMLFSISPIICLLCSFLCFLGMHYADNLYFIIVNSCRKMIMIGIKCELQEQMQYKSFIKMHQIDVIKNICSNFNSYLTVTSSHIPHL